MYVPREPLGLIRSYRTAIASWVALWERETIAMLVSPDFARLREQFRRRRSLDASRGAGEHVELLDATDELDARMRQLGDHIESMQPDDDLVPLMMRTAYDGEAHARREAQMQIRAELGRDVVAPPAENAAARTQGFVRDNLALIGRMRRGTIDEIEGFIRDAWVSGATPEELARTIRRRFKHIAKARAHLIATDQLGKLVGQASIGTFLSAGFERGYWQSRRDNRVRERHRELDGTTFNLRTGVPGERFPGWPIRCRCFTRPVPRRVPRGGFPVAS